jgi:hypothetical protein
MVAPTPGLPARASLTLQKDMTNELNRKQQTPNNNAPAGEQTPHFEITGIETTGGGPWRSI